MEIIRYDRFLNERMKVMPITNDEFDKVGELYKMEEIEQPTFEDICFPGNIVCIDIGIENTEYPPYHGIVMKWERFCKIKPSTSSTPSTLKHDNVILTLNTNDRITYWVCNYFKLSFPYGNDDECLIKNVFKTDIDVSKLNSKDDVVKIYTDYDLKKIF